MPHLPIVRAAVVAALLAGAVVAANAPAGLAQSNEAAIRITGPIEPVDKGDEVPFDITVENVENLAGFGIVLSYDPDILDFSGEAIHAQKGDFLGSSGREVVCPEPIRDAGSMRFTCLTLRFEPAGATGSGKLATITLRARGSGTTEVNISRAQLIAVSQEEPPPEIPSTTTGTSIEVKGSGGLNWLIWGPVIGVAVLAIGGGAAFAAMRMRNTGDAPGGPATQPEG